MNQIMFTQTTPPAWLLAFWKEIDDKTFGEGFNCFKEDAEAHLGVAVWRGREEIRESLRRFIDTGFTAHHDVVEYWDGGSLKVFRGTVTMTPDDKSKPVVRPVMTHFFYMDRQDRVSATLTAQTSENRTLRELLAWAADHLTEDLSVDSLARRAAMSERNFSRVFTLEVGETPARHIETLRLEAARRQLETSSLSLDEVAEHSGFASAEVLRRAFTRRLGVSPGQYRSSFGRLR